MSTENQRPDDRELEAFMSGKSAISREYQRLEKATAPVELDHAVLELARVDLARKGSGKWRVPLALAATVLLSFGALQTWKQDETARGQAMFEEVIPAAEVSEPLALPPPAAKANAASGPALTRPALQLKRKAQPSTPPPAPPPSAAIMDAPSGQVPPLEKKQEFPAQQAGALAAERDQASESERQERPAPAAEARRKSEQRHLYSMPAEGPKPALMMAPPVVSSPAAPPISVPDWIKRIRELRDLPDLVAAKRELQEFIRTFPEQPVPDDLKPLLQ